METEKISLIYIPRISLYKLTDKLSKKAIVKFVQTNANNPDWVGSLKVVIDNNNFVFIKFNNRENGSLYSKCKVDSYPSQSIQLIPDLEKCFHLKLHDQNGEDFTNVLSFIDKADANEFKSSLKTYFKNAKSNPKQSLEIIKAQQGQRLLHSEKGSRFFELYLKEIIVLNELTVLGYEKICDHYQKYYSHALKFINEPKAEDLYKKIFTTENDASIVQKDNQRKRTVNEITIIADDEKENMLNQEGHAKTIKSKSKKGKIKKNEKKDEDKNDQVGDGSKTDLIKNEAKVGNPTKKQRVSNESSGDSDVEIVEPEVKNKKKPQRVAKTKANKKISKTKTSKSSQRSTLESVSSAANQMGVSEEQNALSKTPSANRFRIEAYESATKTIKAEPVRPITRANGGKVKQAVQIFEQMKSQTSAIPVPTNQPLQASATKSQHTNEASQRILRVNASKVRSSIDKRKLRTSQAKSEAKRKSVKKVNAFVKAATCNDLNTTVSKQKPFTATTTTTTTSTTVAASTTLIDQTIYEENAKSAERRMTKDILSSTIVQQQYRVTTTFKSGMKFPERKNSFAKFLERNTPTKMTKTELEERKKAELNYKAKKEEERLLEREKQQKEKIETSKKKREEKMMKIKESKAKRQEEDLKRREELEAKAKEMEETKKRLAEEKKREEQKAKEARLAEEKRKQEESLAQSKLMHSQHNTNGSMLGSAIKPKPIDSRFHLPPTSKPAHSEYDFVSSQNKFQNPLNDKHKAVVMLNKLPPVQQKPLETTYVLNTPGVDNHKVFSKPPSLATKLLNNSLYNQFSSNPNNYPATPFAEPKLKDANNYDVSNLKSDDETDDEEEPSKPIPPWAKMENIHRKAVEQSMKLVNYTKIFKEASNCEIKLDEIFRTKRKKFNERSSSANWSSPPIWRTGINGEESFRKLHFK